MDSLHGLARSLNHALTASGLPTHTAGSIRGFIGDGAKILIQRATPEAADEMLRNTVEEEFKHHYELNWPSGTFAYEGIVPLLEELQRISHPLAVLSNKPHPFTQAIVSRMFPTVRFSSVLGQRTGIPHKPDPAGALEISHQLNLSPGDCTVIGDSIMDLETARNAGMRAVAVAWGFHDRERLVAAGAGAIADCPADLLEILSLKPAGFSAPDERR